jgi:hypothetical protein
MLKNEELICTIGFITILHGFAKSDIVIKGLEYISMESRADFYCI